MKTFRTRFHALVLACACVTLVHDRASAEDSKEGLSPEIAARCTEFLNKVNAAQRKELDKRMAAEIADVAKVAGLDATSVRSLEAAAVTAEDAAQADLMAKALEMYTKVYTKVGTRGLSELSNPRFVEMATRPDSRFDSQIPYTQATDQPAWKDAVTRLLTPEQAQAWQKAQEDRTGAVSKEFEDLLDRQADQVRAGLSGPVLTGSVKIIDTLNLPKDRADEVAALANKAVDASMEAWRKEARRQYRSYNESTRARITRERMVYFGTREEDKPENQAVWKDGVAKLLSADDRARLESSQGTQRKRRTHALAMLMLTLMDEKVALTTSQRPKLEPVMERLVQKVDEFYPQPDRNNEYFNLNAASFYKAATAASAEEVRPILDDLQWKHWQDASREKVSSNEEEEEEAQPTPGPASVAAVEEPEDLEQLVSDYLAAKAAAQRKELDAAMLLQAEDAGRVAGLPPATAERLRTAAHGAAEAALVSWSSSVEQTVRAQVQTATRETVQQRLNSTSRFYFNQVFPKEEAVWKTAVKSELTKPQQDAWQTERDARARYSDEAVTQFILAEFDRNFVLGSDQWDRLAVLLTQAMHDYRPDINEMFSNASQWYLTSYYMFLPFHAIPEDDCKAIIGKERYDRWAESNGYRYSVQYWTNLKQNHAQRTKEEKK